MYLWRGAVGPRYGMLLPLVGLSVGGWWWETGLLRRLTFLLQRLTSWDPTLNFWALQAFFFCSTRTSPTSILLPIHQLACSALLENSTASFRGLCSFQSFLWRGFYSIRPNPPKRPEKWKMQIQRPIHDIYIFINKFINIFIYIFAFCICI